MADVSEPRGALAVPGVPDTTAPTFEPPVLAFDDCARVRIVLSEDASVTATFEAGGAVVTAMGQGQGGLREVATRLDDLPPMTAGTLRVEAADAAGNRTFGEPVPFSTPPARPRLVLTEILANPAGPEPDQELVEITNQAAASVSLAGLLLEDGGGGDPLPDVVLAPGGRAVVVGERFIDGGGEDPAVAPGAVVVRVPGRIGRDGLANAGEVVTLRDAAGGIISRYGGWVDVSAAAWNGRSVHRKADGACDGPGAWTTSPEAPTPGW